MGRSSMQFSPIRLIDGLAFMDKSWDSFKTNAEYQAWVTEWASLLIEKALYPGAVCLFFGGTRTFHRLACGLEDAGFEVVDTLMWLYGSGFPKGHDISKSIDRTMGAEREVAGIRKHPTLKDTSKVDRQSATQYHATNPVADEWPITIPATEMAEQWNGWNTALKPAWEPVVLCPCPHAASTATWTWRWSLGLGRCGLTVAESKHLEMIGKSI